MLYYVGAILFFLAAIDHLNKSTNIKYSKNTRILFVITGGFFVVAFIAAVSIIIF
jgi:hypothetical protein